MIQVAVAGAEPSQPEPPTDTPGIAQTQGNDAEQEPTAGNEEINSSEPSDINSPPAAAPVSNPASGQLKVHFLDVGQADSILIQAPSGKTMLIDAGNNGDDNLVISYIRNQGISKLDIVVGTHPHEDHIGGLDAVINTFDIGQVVMPTKTHTTQTYKDVLTAIKNKGLKITAAKAGVDLDLGQGVTAKLVGPPATYDDLNNNSAVIHLSFGNTSFLFTGDAEKDAEADILAAGYNIRAEVLKVGHHGSSTSTSQSFLNKVKPAYAVITAGKGNDYGHPHDEILTRLANIGAKIFRTDINGTIIASSNGSKVTFNTQPITAKTTAPSPAPKTSPAPTPPPQTKPETPPPTSAGDENIIVYKTKTGEKYHVNGCGSLSRSKIEISFKKAKEQGLGPCSKCKPPQ
ncbi:MAG: MBL fold metallo-hydrolase [Peptococcaceae bacterium]|nr:MBL fold metallo-hydrolase [Peptococcaceae bacterium]